MGRLARWCMTLNQYGPSIQYIKGKDNFVADALSRAPFAPEITSEDMARDPTADVRLVKDMREKILKAAGISEEDLAGLDEADLGPPETHSMTTVCMDGETAEPEQYHPLLLPRVWARAVQDNQLPPGVRRAGDGLLYIERRPGSDPLLWVPPQHRHDVLRVFHQGPLRAHQAADSMLKALQKEAWWAGCETAIRKHCKRCGHCQLYRADRPDKPPLQSRGDLFRPFQRVSLDILVLRGIPGANTHHYVLVIVDELTRYAEAYPLKNHTAETVSRVFLDHFMTRYGVPREILTDRGAEFVGEVFTIMCRNLKMRKLHTCAYRPQGNGANERVHQTLYTLLRNVCKEHPSNWRQYLPYAMYAYHTQHHRSIGMTPQEAMYGYTARVIPFDDAALPPATSLQERIQMLQTIRDRVSSTSEAELAEQRKMAKTRPSPVYDVGDLVKVANRMKHKLDPKWRGPYVVVRRVSTTSYEVKLNQGERIHHIVHHAHLRPWYAPDDDDMDAVHTDAEDDDLDHENDEEREDEDPRPEDPRILPSEDPLPRLQNEDPLPRLPVKDPSTEDDSNRTNESSETTALPTPSQTRENNVEAETPTQEGEMQSKDPPRRLYPIEEEDPSSSDDDAPHPPPRIRPGLQPRAQTRTGRNIFPPAKYRD
jgi:transposase InsO family protein